MRLRVIAVGRLKDGPERRLYEHYEERLTAAGRSVALAPFSLHEMQESRLASAEARKGDEAARMQAHAGDGAVMIALDERGKAMTSPEFADWLRAERNGGTKEIHFLIGGPDGHGSAVLAAARLRLSLGAMTLPHGLARVVLMEQLYRAETIIAGHPYHRA